MAADFQPGEWVRKVRGHRFYGSVVSVGETRGGNVKVTVQHFPDGWVFHFRGDELEPAEPPSSGS